MGKELTALLAQWHEEDEHQKIIDTLLEVPPTDRDYETTICLGRAYNNLELYDQALKQFAIIEEQGQNDPFWFLCVGYSYYYLNQHVDAVKALSIANAMNPEDKKTAMFLDLSRREQQQEEQALARRALSRQRRNSGAAVIPFEGMDFSGFWNDSDYALSEYVCAPPTVEMIASIEEELNYKLPASYIALMKQHNGGVPYNTCFPTEEATSWAEDHIAITGIMGIGREKSYSLCGDLGSPFMIEEWGYPDIGVVICDCPSAGHDVVMLDYRYCGKDDEPEVIHVDQENNYKTTFLAPDFETFIRGLVNIEEHDTSEEDEEDDLRIVAEGEFSPLLAELCSHNPEVHQLEQKIRNVCTRIVKEKGHFSFHADELSSLMYDVQFWLYTKSYPNTSHQKYLDIYEEMIAMDGEFTQGGYAPGFVSDWLNGRIQEGLIIQENGTLRFTDEAGSSVIARLEAEAADEV